MIFRRAWLRQMLRQEGAHACKGGSSYFRREGVKDCTSGLNS